MISCGEKVEQKVAVPIQKHSLTYNLDVKLEILKKGINLYETFPPSGKQIPMYFVAISIKNLSKDTFNICHWTCSFEKQIIFEPQIIKVLKVCDANFIVCRYLLLNQKIVFQTFLKDPTQYWYLQNMNKLRIGFKISTIVESQNVYKKIVKDTDLIFWSNYVDLRNYKISPKIIKKAVIIMDSLDNEINNYIKYPYYPDY